MQESTSQATTVARSNTQETGSILVVDDDRIILDSLSEFLRLEGYRVEGATGVREAISILEREKVNVLITDINMPESDGFEMLQILRKRFPDVVVIMITGYGTIESAVEAIKLGAYDYLTKPIIDDEIRLVVERALNQQALVREVHTLRKQLDMRFGLDNVVGHDYMMLKVFDVIEAVAASKVTVLVQGESGTGKSMIARCIHHRSDRKSKPFVEVSCGSLPESLLESELFGHARGSFTGAVADKIGKFKAADGGTIFLDEIATASQALQVKLLRVLQEKQFEPVGSNKTETVDLRVILATNVDLEAEIAAGRFRQDLYYRINVVNIALPALRERISDVELLAKTFLHRYCGQMGKEPLSLTEEAILCLQRYQWPGNVRELENIIERAVVLTKNRAITIDDLPPKLVAESTAAPALGESYQLRSLKEALEDPERRIIEAALKAHGWNRQATSQALDINRTTLYKKMKRYRLDDDPVMQHS